MKEKSAKVEARSDMIVLHNNLHRVISYRDIPVEDIVVVKEDRIRHDPTRGIEDLIKSIKALGLLQPIIVKEQVNYGRAEFILLAGESRLEAFKAMGRDTIPAQVRMSLTSATTSQSQLESLEA